VLDELIRLNVEFISFREQIDTGGPLGRAIVVIIGAIAELERSLIAERVRAGMRRAKLEGRHIGGGSPGPGSNRDPQRPAERSEPGTAGEDPSGEQNDDPSGTRRANPGRYKRGRKSGCVNPTESRPDR